MLLSCLWDLYLWFCFYLFIFSKLKVLKCISQCPGKYPSQQPIRGEPQHTPGALPDREQPERELWCGAGRTPESSNPPHRLQPTSLLPCQVCHFAFLLFIYNLGKNDTFNVHSSCWGTLIKWMSVIYECCCTTSFYVLMIYILVSSKLSKLELLEELNLSGNKLKTIPSTVSSCKRLHTLIAHSNQITVFPDILNLPEIKVRFVSFDQDCL